MRMFPSMNDELPPSFATRIPDAFGSVAAFAATCNAIRDSETNEDFQRRLVETTERVVELTNQQLRIQKIGEPVTWANMQEYTREYVKLIGDLLGV